MTLYWRILQFGRRKKDHGSPTLCTFKDLSWSYGNLDLAASNSRNTRKFFSYSSAKFCLFQTFCIISSVLFPFKLLLVSLLTLPPNIQQLNIAWLMMRSTLHVSLYRKTLCITTMGDGRRGREKRGILKCSVVFNASNEKKKFLNIVLFHEIARYLAEHLKMEILTNCLVHGNSFARSIRKISKIPKNTKNV